MSFSALNLISVISARKIRNAEKNWDFNFGIYDTAAKNFRAPSPRVTPIVTCTPCVWGGRHEIKRNNIDMLNTQKGKGNH